MLAAWIDHTGRDDAPGDGLVVVGLRALHAENGELLVVSIRSAPGKELWSATDATHPGRAILKRRFIISEWTITEWSNDFDLRRRPPRPVRSVADLPARPGRKHPPLDPAAAIASLDAASAAARTALQSALAEIDAGRLVDTSVQRLLADWNSALQSVARSLALSDGDVNREQINRAVEDLAAKNRVVVARREELDAKIEALDVLIDRGNLGRDELVKARRALRDLRTESRSRLF